MKILITMTTNSELLSYEATALAFLLASFDHEIQIYLTGDVFEIISCQNSRISGMLQSLELYDIPKAWVDKDDLIKLPKNIMEICQSDFTKSSLDPNQKIFDSYLLF